MANVTSHCLRRFKLSTITIKTYKIKEIQYAITLTVQWVYWRRMKVYCDLPKKKQTFFYVRLICSLDAEMIHLLRWHFDGNCRKTNNGIHDVFFSLGKSLRSRSLKVYCFWKHLRFDMWSTASCITTLQQIHIFLFILYIYTNKLITC